MTPNPTAPRTAAGRAEHYLQHRLHKTFCDDDDKYGGRCLVRKRIEAIEAEAAATECSSCGADRHLTYCHECYWRMVERADQKPEAAAGLPDAGTDSRALRAALEKTTRQLHAEGANHRAGSWAFCPNRWCSGSRQTIHETEPNQPWLGPEYAAALAAAPDSPPAAPLRPDWTTEEGTGPIPIEQAGYLPLAAPEREVSASPHTDTQGIDVPRLTRAISAAYAMHDKHRTDYPRHEGLCQIMRPDPGLLAAAIAAYDAAGANA